MTQSVLIIGATGNIGGPIAEALFRHKSSFSNLAVFTTETSLNNTDKKKNFDKLTEQGFKIVVGDLNNKQSLINAFKGYDVVLSTLAAENIEKQIDVIDAAVEAGVKRFYPSEFATETFSSYYKSLSALQGKVKVREHLEQVVKKHPNFTYTLFNNGLFAELVYTPLVDFDVRNHTVTVIGDINTKFSTTTIKDIAEFFVASLLDPSVGRNGSISVQGDQITWRESIDIIEKLQGVKYEVKTISEEESKRQEEEFLKEGKFLNAAVHQIRRLLASGHSSYEQPDNHHFKQVKTESFESFAKGFVANLKE
jgi:uncharacterized protein YbjT (DUF2867 family)